MNDLNLLKKVNIEKIADEGQKIYEKVKNQYEPDKNGKFLAIDVESEEVFLAENSAKALLKAQTKYPDRVFFVVKIGFTEAETLVNSYFQ